MSTRLRHLSRVLLCLLALVAIGCASRGYQQASTTASNISKLKAELEAAKERVDTSVAALDKVVAANDPAEPYEEFVRAVARLDGQANTIRAQADAVRSAGATYFKEWEAKLAAFASDEMRQLSEARREDLMKALDEVNSVSQATKEAYEPFMADLSDIQQFLGLDLSTASVSAIGDKVTKVKDDAGNVQAAIDELVKTLEDLSGKLATRTAPAGDATDASAEANGEASP